MKILNLLVAIDLFQSHLFFLSAGRSRESESITGYGLHPWSGSAIELAHRRGSTIDYRIFASAEQRAHWKVFANRGNNGEHLCTNARGLSLSRFIFPERGGTIWNAERAQGTSLGAGEQSRYL